VSEFSYDGYGNVNEERDWDSTKNASQPTCSQMAQLNSGNAVVLNFGPYTNGNIQASYDGNGIQTEYVYDSNNVYLTAIYQAYGKSLQRATSYSFDSSTGLLNSKTDYNGLTTSYTYDNLERPTVVQESGASGLLRKTTTSYEDINRRVVTYDDRATPGDQQLISVVDYDQLGRQRLTRQLESTSQGVDDDTTGIKTQTRYMYANGSGYQLVSNPFRAGTSGQAGGESTMGWTLSKLDTNGRTTNVWSVTGAGAPWPFGSNGSSSGEVVVGYSAQTTTVTDQAGVYRTNTVDGLGRLLQVVENGISATTNYTYDALGNLVSVTPASGNGRSFVYDSLARLKTATNPESATTSYLYDNASNLTQRTDGRGITSTLIYDALNRLTTRQYSDYNNPHPTPGVSYSYAGTTTDFVSQVTAGSNGYTYSNYDALGRPGSGTQTAASGSYPFTNLGWTPQGQLASITYPSGRVVTTTLDGAGRPAGVSGSLSGNNTTYASGVSYAAQGGVAAFAGGDGLSRAIGYNARLQTATVSATGRAGSLLSLGFTYSSTGTQDNGNVTQQTITRPSFSVTQSYSYDGANRLSAASESPGSGTNWSQSYVYDKAGNRALTSGSSIVVSNYTPQSSDGVTVPFDANNHWISAAGYDGAGNMTSVRTQTMQFDAESRMYSWADSSTGASVALTYDGDGRRVTKTVGSTTTTYVYDPAGNLAAEYGGAAISTQTLYLTQDHLGSTRLVTDGSGNQVGCHDYLPFGEEVPGSWGTHPTCYGQVDTAVKFTGQERDPETAADGSGLTGFDNFQARMFASRQGRFLMTDPDNAGADATNPQSWNMYSYVLNTPLVMIDPTGLYGSCSGGWGTVPNGDGTTSCAPPPWYGPTIWDLSNGYPIGGPIGNPTTTTTFTYPAPKVTKAPQNLTGPFNVLDCAGYKAARSILPQTKAQGIEFGGLIYKNDQSSSYFYSAPFSGTAGALPSFDVHRTQDTPGGFSLAGWYHSHPLVYCFVNK